MTLKFSESPAVQIKEIDLTGTVPAVTSTTGALVGDFNWGPVNKPILIGNESELASVFGNPNTGNVNVHDYISASYFLKYSSSLYVVNINPGAQSSDGVCQGKYPGSLGNKIDVSVRDPEFALEITETVSDALITSSPAESLSVNQAVTFSGTLLGTNIVSGTVYYIKQFGPLSAGGTEIKISDEPNGSVKTFVPETGSMTANVNEYSRWAYESSFTSAPEGDEVHVAVLVDGVITETFEYLSTVEGALTTNGTNNYIVDVINNRSSWINFTSFPSSFAEDFDLTGGTDGGLTPSAYMNGYDAFANKEEIQIDFLIAPPQVNSSGNPAQTSVADVADVHSKMVTIAEQRKDCVAVVSVDYNSALSGDVSGYTAAHNVSSSYLVVDSNWIKVYDKYNDKYVFIPAASSTAGIMSATDKVSAPWFSPAGSRRGQYLGVTELAHNPTKTQRDEQYKSGVNPIVSMSGQGIMLFGDKTHLKRPSAFDRINVRRLFLVIERAISEAGQNVMFEFNDEFTRAEFVNIVEPFLREIQGRRGISDFRVVCDETNNTPEVIDRNEFIASCFIKPARSINYVTLNFVAVRTGVDFEEVVGTV